MRPRAELEDGQTIILVRTKVRRGMEQAISLSVAKAQLAGLVQAAETGEVVHISRHGKPVAVLISEQSYATLQGRQASRRVWAAIAEWRQSGEAIGEPEVEGWRDQSAGREVVLG